MRECGSITIAGWLFTRIVKGSVIKVIFLCDIKLIIEIISTLFSYYTIVSLWDILVATIILSIMSFVIQGVSFFKLVTRSIAIGAWLITISRCFGHSSVNKVTTVKFLSCTTLV